MWQKDAKKIFFSVLYNFSSHSLYKTNNRFFKKIPVFPKKNEDF